MKNKLTLSLFILFISLTITSCFEVPEDVIVQGMTPLYADDYSDPRLVSTQEPREIENQGITRTFGDYIFVTEELKGIHVFEIQDLGQTVPVYFLNIIGISEYSIQDNNLLCHNSRDFIGIDLSDLSDIEVFTVTETLPAGIFDNRFRNSVFYVPPNYEGLYECVRDDLGIVYDWVEELITNPNCETL